MATTDAFSAQIVHLVRNMPDEAILELVKHQLGALRVSPLKGLAAVAPVIRRGAVGRPAAIANGTTTNGPARRGRPPRAVAEASAKAKRGAVAAPAKRGPGRPRKTPGLSAERQKTVSDVERLVKASSGVSASDVAKSGNIPQARAAAALKELKLAKRIYQGGDRRFARYAADAKTAEQASLNARKNASGPAAAPAPKKAGRGGKRSQGAGK